MKLLIRNLDRLTTEEELSSLFKEFGAVQSCNLVIDRVSCESKGFGFVEMPDSSNGQAAIAGLDGKDLDGRQVKVNEARPREDRSRSGGGDRW